MSNDSRLSDRIAALMHTAKAERDSVQAQIEDEMEGYAKRARLAYANFNDISRALEGRVVKLASLFENAEATCGYTTFECRFRHTRNFPATASARFHIGHNAAVDRIAITFDALVLPILMDLERHDEILLPISQVNTGQVSLWVEDKLIAFMKDYLRIRVHPLYQRGNMTVDPVCGRSVNKLDAVPFRRGAMTAYFCSIHCLELQSERTSAQQTVCRSQFRSSNGPSP